MKQALSFEVQNPISKKNKMVYGKGRVWKSKNIEEFEGNVFIAAHNAKIEQGWEETGNAICMSIKYDAKNDLALIAIVDTGKKPPKRRKDLQNLPDVICDVLQRAGIYLDDRQITRIEVYDA